MFVIICNYISYHESYVSEGVQNSTKNELWLKFDRYPITNIFKIRQISLSVFEAFKKSAYSQANRTFYSRVEDSKEVVVAYH